jgi:hypothetical protein
MTAEPRWQPFGIQPPTWENVPEHDGTRIVNVSWRRPRQPGDRAPGARLITTATVLLGLLAAGLFVVSLAAQYRYVLAEKHQAIPAMIEAIGLDVGMAIFSLLALGLAMAGQSARVERVLIVACAAGSAAMNYAGANGGSPRSVAAYVMPPIFLAIVVDRVVAVVRRHVIGDTERSAWTGAARAAGMVALYGLRFVLAAPSTASGLRRQVLIMTPLPGKAVPELPAGPAPAAVSIPDEPQATAPVQAREPDIEAVVSESTKRQGKTARFLLMVQDRYGPLSAIDPAKVSQIATDLAPEVDLHPGSARSALRPLVLAAQNGHAR